MTACVAALSVGLSDDAELFFGIRFMAAKEAGAEMSRPEKGTG
ncbi:hypothetical protein ATPR_1141 [Acetobacter tropicalis NBRC 101654]|uniref:Uncharacterized protein n=1 Tax=Acetobacter tropicalis NBRC 101654 TaxID=749388 RepID=F7VCP2_9PROT|nr:hypothetical protein ATPR_1141 [Acetobacter tropicalis NBRC 101654]